MFSWVNLGFPIEDLGSSTKNLGFPGKIWGSQRERTHAKRSAHVPKVARAKLRAFKPNGVRACESEGWHAQRGTRGPIERRRGEDERGHAKPRGHMPEGACASQTEGARAEQMTHMPKGAHTCRFPCKIWCFERERACARGSVRGTNLWGGARSSPRGCAHANRRERMPKGARTSQAEGARARMSACMPNGGRTCPRERAKAKRRARVPNGWHTCCFACKFRGFQRERARVEQRAHVPKVARVGRMGGVQAQVGARMPI